MAFSRRDFRALDDRIQTISTELLAFAELAAAQREVATTDSETQDEAVAWSGLRDALMRARRALREEADVSLRFLSTTVQP